MANNTLLASDDFQRANGSLGANWTAIPTYVGGQIVSNVVEPTALSTNCGQYYSGISWSSDHISQVTIGALTAEAGTQIQVIVRQQSGANTCYTLVLQNSNVQLYKVIAGVATSLQNGGTYTTVAGDVWTLEAAGPCITAYCNGKRYVRVVDSSVPSGGAPGFLQSSTVNITHTKVSAWAGFSMVQQDGVWTKQGLVLPALSGDLPLGTYINSAILYEGGAQVLSGTVYKMWFSSGSNIAYAESTDGITWTRYASNPVITGNTIPTVMKVGSTYYLYCQATAGSSSFSLYTSTNGINWSLQSSTILGKGTAGQWDSAFVYIFQPVAIIAGTWYGLYSGGNNATTFTGSVGLATSSDGITWTKYGSNPIISDAWNSQAIAQINGTWYMWVESNQPGQGSSHAPGLDPTECVRWQSTDLITWTNPTKSFHITEYFEGLNSPTGAQAFPNSIIQVGSQTYMYYTATTSDGASPQGYQIGLAIAPATLASLVANKEDAMPVVTTDAFTGGAGDLNANWTTPTGWTKLQVVSGPFVEATVINTTCGMRYSGGTFSNDHWSEVTIQALGTGDFAQPYVRLQANHDCYHVNISTSGGTGTVYNNFAIYKIVGGVETALTPLVTVTPHVGDRFRLAVQTVNGLPVLTAYQNDFVILQAEDPSNGVPSGGSPGMAIFTSSLAAAQISSWSGGNAGVIPTYPTLSVPTVPATATEVYLSQMTYDSVGPIPRLVENTSVVDSPPSTGNISPPQAPSGAVITNTGRTTIATKTFMSKLNNQNIGTTPGPAKN